MTRNALKPSYAIGDKAVTALEFSATQREDSELERLLETQPRRTIRVTVNTKYTLLKLMMALKHIAYTLARAEKHTLRKLCAFAFSRCSTTLRTQAFVELSL